MLEAYRYKSIAEDYDKQESERQASRQAAQQKADAEAKRIAAAKREASFRTWASSTGNHTTEAILLSYGSGSVTLERRDGKKIKVELAKLSDADRAYVEKWRKEKRK